jgi:serine protease Do
MKKGIILVLAVGIILAISLLAKNSFFTTNNVIFQQSESPGFTLASEFSPDSKGLDFTVAAEKTINGVVHIRALVTETDPGKNYPDQFRQFFDNHPPMQREGLASGSGVIISEQGYIVTNNHVVENSSKIEVVLNDNRSFEAEIVGVDPTTDLAVIKVKENSLPSLSFANSDEVRIGQWVLAVGNPFNLSSTVTAGIVSAKARNINILREAYSVESFIQTDAVINRGNSGGALVNLNGDLIGINSAIATPTGTYAGYGFAIPSNLVKKVSADLIEYGVVQRAIMGIMIRNVDSRIADRMNLKDPIGVLVDSLTIDAGANKAGIRKGDVIVLIDETTIKSVPELMEYVARKRPGDKIIVEVIRNSEHENFTVELVNRNGKSELLARIETPESLEVLGIEISNLSSKELKDFDIEGGVKILKVNPGKIRSFTSIKPGFIVTQVNKSRVKGVDDFIKKVESESGGIMLEGIYPDRGGRYYYAFGK